jgi:hypothetical protein
MLKPYEILSPHEMCDLGLFGLNLGALTVSSEIPLSLLVMYFVMCVVIVFSFLKSWSQSLVALKGNFLFSAFQAEKQAALLFS